MCPTINNALVHDFLDAIDATFNGGTLQIRTGAAPGAANAAAGTVLATVVLPADAFAAASARTKVKAGTWEDLSIDATGTAGHWRLTNVGATRVMEGTVGVGTGELQLSTLSFVATGAFTITAFTLGATNAAA